LIVDDLESNRQVMLGLLEAYGLETEAAGGGREALDRAAARPYDLVFMDQVMEDDLDGVATLQALRLLPGHGRTPVVALTANALAGTREFFLAHGFQDYISKPIDPLLLDAVLAAWLPEEKRALKEQPAGKEDVPAAPVMAGAVRLELAIQRIDLLRHYHWHFVNGLPTDATYGRNFSLLVEALLDGFRPDLPAALLEEGRILAEAGRRGEAETIRRGLPGFYKAMAAWSRQADAGEAGEEAEKAALKLSKLKKALEKDDEAEALALMAQLRDIPFTALPGEVRELYFLLYDMLMMGETEKAAGALALWSKLPYGNLLSKIK
jgi:CheY-like chemotaxis protein